MEKAMRIITLILNFYPSVQHYVVLVQDIVK